MLDWNQLNQRLEKIPARHNQLTSKFELFAKHVESQVTAQGFHISGITASLKLEQGLLITTFAGRTLTFAFSSILEENQALMGHVKCYLTKELEEQKQIEIGEFTFKANGESNLTSPQEVDEPLSIDIDLAALYIALQFIYESLSK
ncbi:MAG: hypothetical protein HOP34_00655 [Methylococcaceae bacterium]|nr:hypothetical protein [Methylococcaceae bacterium]